MDTIAEKAIAAMHMEDTGEAMNAVSRLVAEAPERLDLRHSLATLFLRAGNYPAARETVEEALRMLAAAPPDTASTLRAPLLLLLANAQEEMALPREAEQSYLQLLDQEPGHSYARLRYGYLLVAWGRAREGVEIFEDYAARGEDDPDSLQAHRSLAEGIRAFMDSDTSPENFLRAHMECYVEEFDLLAAKMESQGWHAEAARMTRAEDGSLRPVIAEGARPYAGIRVDLVNPETMQPGRIGEAPLLVGLQGHEALAQLPVVTEWPGGHPFPVYVSSQCPWNNLSIQIRMIGDPGERADGAVGAWYEEGFNGAFGTGTKGMLHEISEPVFPGPSCVAYYVDCGRAGLSAVDDLLARLGILHASHPLAAVLLGNGQLPM